MPAAEVLVLVQGALAWLVAFPVVNLVSRAVVELRAVAHKVRIRRADSKT